MQTLISEISSLLPDSWNVPDLLILGLVIALGLLILGWLIRLIRGKESDLNQALSTAIAILFLCGIAAVIYSFFPDYSAWILAPLPFISFKGDYITLFPLTGAAFTTVCSEAFSMVVLAFIVNLLAEWIPDGEKVLGWYLRRILAVILAIILHFAVMHCFDVLLPGSVAESAPMILLGILVGLMLIGVLKVVLGVVLTIANPIIGAIYAFFFSHKIGRQLTKAVLTAVILALLVLLMSHLGFSQILISPEALLSYLPLILILLVIWYLIGHSM